MDFMQYEADRELASLCRKILTDQLTPERLAGAESGGGIDRELWADLAAAGVLSAALPESLGGVAGSELAERGVAGSELAERGVAGSELAERGAGLGLLAHCAVLAELGREVAPVPYLPSIVLGAGALARFGTAEQQHRWAAPAGRGELILAAALSEEDGDDPLAPSASAEPIRGEGAAGGGWRLSGVKTAVLAAPLAGLLLVPAATPADVAVFLVDPAADGVTVQRQQITGGTAGRVELDGVYVGEGDVLGGPAAGREVTGWLVAHGTVGLCALQYGVAARALELTSAYAQGRVQFGKPIGGFQAVAQRLADAYIDVEAIRLTMWQAAWRLSAGLPCDTEVATAKFWAADAGHRVAHTAVHVHGGVGIDMDYPVHRYFAAATHNEFTLGGATVQLRRIGAALASNG